jgi:hypothetical protein
MDFGSMMSSIHPWAARFQLKLYLFPNEFMYLSECLTGTKPIEVKRRRSVGCKEGI